MANLIKQGEINHNYLNHRCMNTGSETLHFRQGKHFIFCGFTNTNSKQTYSDISTLRKKVLSLLRHGLVDAGADELGWHLPSQILKKQASRDWFEL